MRVFNSVSELIGGTPLVELKNIERDLGLGAVIYAKIESCNPCGSAKDRVAREMVLDALERGALTDGGTIIEPTSGNTGIGLAAYAVPRGFRVIIVMPDSMSAERMKLMKAYGAELVLTQGSLGMAGAIARAKELHEEIENSFIPDQFSNPANAQAHYKTTGPEIWNDTDGDTDILIAGIGTGGTLTGAGKYLKEKNRAIQIVAVEPKGSAVLSGGCAGAHGLQGIGAGFVPEVLDLELIDRIVTVEDSEAYSVCRLLAGCEGLLCGISSGAALHAAITEAKRVENKGKKIVVILPDTGDRYLSTDLF